MYLRVSASRCSGAVGDELSVAADLDEAGGVAGVDDEQADLPVGEQVAPLLPLERRVEPSTLPVVIDPDQARLRLAIPTHRRQYPADRPRQQVEV